MSGGVSYWAAFLAEHWRLLLLQDEFQLLSMEEVSASVAPFHAVVLLGDPMQARWNPPQQQASASLHGREVQSGCRLSSKKLEALASHTLRASTARCSVEFGEWRSLALRQMRWFLRGSYHLAALLE